jgi:hypothetical protein
LPHWGMRPREETCQTPEIRLSSHANMRVLDWHSVAAASIQTTCHAVIPIFVLFPFTKFASQS